MENWEFLNKNNYELIEIIDYWIKWTKIAKIEEKWQGSSNIGDKCSKIVNI